MAQKDFPADGNVVGRISLLCRGQARQVAKRGVVNDACRGRKRVVRVLTSGEIG